ncbi:MAG: hypothetical protein IJ391_08380 [Clostridia bacterium]|nr:hypothetical protein [Clostridia bacterium]
MKLKTSHSLLISIVSMLLTLVMLASTTFAWFTETIESGHNVISTGNLDLVVNYSFDGETWKPLDATTVLFNEDGKATYEPGYTEFVYLELINDGELAFNYQTALKVYAENKGKNVDGESFALSDIIKVGVKEGASFSDVKLASREEAAELSTGSFEAGKTLTTSVGPLASKGDTTYADTTYVALVIHMPTTVGNEANYDDSDSSNKPSIDFAVNVLATQAEVESDDFGTNYDASANKVVSSVEDFIEALGEGGDIQLAGTINRAEGEYDTPWAGTDLTADYSYYHSAGDLSITGGTIKADNAAKFGFAIKGGNDIEVKLNNVAFEGNSQSLLYLMNYSSETPAVLNNVKVTADGGSGIYAEYAPGGVVINNATVKQSGLGDGYYSWFETAIAAANGSNVTVNGGYYESSKYAIYAFGSEGNASTITVNGGTFVGDIMVGGKDEVIIKGGTFTVNPADVSGVTVIGTVVDNGDGTWTVQSETVLAATVDEVKTAIESGNDVILTSDLVLSAVTEFNAPANAEVTIDLNGQTISSETVTSTLIKAVGEGTVNLENGTVEAPNAAVIGIFDDSQMYIKNCVFEGKYGFGMNGSTTSENSYAYFENCEFRVSSGYNAAYISAKGTYEFKNCILEGGAGALVRSGNVSFDGCKFIANGYMGKGNEQSDIYVNYAGATTSDVVKDGIAYWDKDGSEKSTGDALVIIEDSGSGYDLKSVSIKNCKFEVTQTVEVDGETVPTGYAVRFLDRDPSNGTMTVEFENNTDLDGNEIKTGDIGLVYSAYPAN